MFSSRIQCMLFTLLVTFTYFEKYLTMRGGAISLMCLFQPPPIFFALPRPPPGRCCQLSLHHTCAHPAPRRSFDVLLSIVRHCCFSPQHIDPKRKHTLSSLSLRRAPSPYWPCCQLSPTTASFQQLLHTQSSVFPSVKSAYLRSALPSSFHNSTLSSLLLLLNLSACLCFFRSIFSRILRSRRSIFSMN